MGERKMLNERDSAGCMADCLLYPVPTKCVCVCGWLRSATYARPLRINEKKPSEQYRIRQKSVSDCQISACLSVIKAFIFIRFLIFLYFAVMA